MAKISKKALLARVEEAVRAGGWNLLYLDQAEAHPARYQIYNGDSSFKVRVYIWTLTPGGGNRKKNEYRIQITGVEDDAGVNKIEPEIDGKTVILGWWQDAEIFVGFDYNFHAGVLGDSPSIQVKKEALIAANQFGFAPYNKNSNELVIAFRPEFLATYIENLDSLHEFGKSDSETAILEKIARLPADGKELETMPQQRRYAIVTTKKGTQPAAGEPARGRRRPPRPPG